MERGGEDSQDLWGVQWSKWSVNPCSTSKLRELDKDRNALQRLAINGWRGFVQVRRGLVWTGFARQEGIG